MEIGSTRKGGSIAQPPFSTSPRLLRSEAVLVERAYSSSEPLPFSSTMLTPDFQAANDLLLLSKKKRKKEKEKDISKN